MGRWAKVRKEVFGRGGQEGEVVRETEDGIALDFYVDIFGERRGPSIEHFEHHEIAWVDAPTEGEGCEDG